jgi:hypothetical protein
LKKPSLNLSGISNWNKDRKQKKKEKEEHERQLETPMLKMFTFAITAVTMALAMSILPLFPQPLPIFLAILVAFATYIKPRLGMPVGGLIIGLGLLFHLSQLYFISFLGDTPARVVFIVVWMTLFVAMPLLFNRYRSALAIDFGILAFAALCYEPIFFLAIPLILASAVYFKKYVGLTVVYYVLLSVPLQLVQYYQDTVLKIVQSDWWTVPGSAPPLFVSLSSISGNLTSSMSQFRLYDTSKVIYDIAGQTTWVPDWGGRTIKDALSQYLDSLPGILMFVVIVVGLALLMIFFTQTMVKSGLIGSGDRFFPCFTATIAAALFFVLLNAFQIPLAFTADVTATTMVLGIFGTLLLTLPVMFMDYAPKQRATNQEISEKAQKLLDKVITFDGQLANVKENIPVSVTSPQGKTLVLQDSVQDIKKRADAHEFIQNELDEKIVELNKLDEDYGAVEAELNSILYEYQVFSNCEFANWVGKLKNAGLNIQTTLPIDYQKEMTIDERIETIKQIVEGGRSVVREVQAIAEPIYDIIGPLYDPSLPQKSKAVEFADEKLAKNEAPWIAIEAFYNALNNWARQYGKDIQDTMAYLQRSLKPIAYLSSKADLLPGAFGDNTAKVLDYAKKADGLKLLAEKRAEKEKLEILDVVNLKEDVLGFIAMSNDVLSMLYANLIRDEDTIEHLLPTKDFMWEKNASLRDRLGQAKDMLSNPQNYRINEIMENLPKFLSYVDEAVLTLAAYDERKEFLLNYPLAEAAITEQLKNKEKLLPSDLPFRPQFAAEYLRLYYSQRYGEYVFDKENFMLTRRE